MSNSDNKHQYTNDLIHESSPYLLQHAHNPVNWYPWGEEALEKARKENKMLIISIGYAACHWCHVMEHESFEDTDVAKIMNENFIAIKVDREERPDVDQVYMNAVNLISGRGGWPLNALALPDGKPFYAGTYYPKDDWVKVLEYFIEMNKNQPEILVEQAEKVSQGIHSLEYIPMNEEKLEFTMDQADNTVSELIANMDLKKGGINRAPKFPMPSVWELLLHYSYLSEDEKALDAAVITLDNMAMGGIYDHVGGGFARYSVDADWFVPHFEKMLYDNGQLVSLYSHAWQVTGNNHYRDVVYETLEFVARELTSPEGGFYSSLDADSEGEEGKFYVWTREEIENALGKDAEIFISYFNIKTEGNWEDGKNILFRSGNEKGIAEKFGISLTELKEKIHLLKAEMLKKREKRIRPGLDDKILTSWNALMLRGYVDAYGAFNEKKFLKAAIKNAEFLLTRAISDSGEITRNHKGETSTINGFLDDYAFTISAFISLYQATFDEKWLVTANKIAAYSMEYFNDQNSGMFFYTHKEQSDLITRNMEISDNVIPGSNSEMAKNLFILGHYYYNEDYLRKSEQMLANVQEDMHKNIFYFSNWGILELSYINKPFEVVILGGEYSSYQKEINNKYLPDVILSGGTKEGDLELHRNKLQEGQTTIYVCRDKMCKLPVYSVNQAFDQINQ